VRQRARTTFNTVANSGLPLADRTCGELEELFGGRRVDLVDPRQLSPRLMRYVMENVEELYAA
jgi:hypothetical protein